MKRGFAHDPAGFRVKWGLILGAGMATDGIVYMVTFGNVYTGLGMKAATAIARARYRLREAGK
jgi:hypothetical protein